MKAVGEIVMTDQCAKNQGERPFGTTDLVMRRFRNALFQSAGKIYRS